MGDAESKGGRRRWVSIVVVALALLAVAAWIYRPSYYLGRLEAEPRGPMSEALRGMGPSVLPDIYSLLASTDDDGLRGE